MFTKKLLITKPALQNFGEVKVLNHKNWEAYATLTNMTA